MKIFTEEIKNQLIDLCDKGKMDSEISEILNIKRGTIWYWRKKLGIKTSFSYDKISKIDNKKFEDLFYKGYNDREIAEKLNMTSDGIYAHRIRHGYLRESYSIAKPIKISKKSLEIIIGILLGDGHLGIGKNCINPKFITTHGPKQKEYSEYICKELKSLKAKINYSKRKTIDRRTGKYYESYSVYTPSNPCFMELYKSFYINKKKHIPFNLLDDFTERSLAFMFMDDGSKCDSGYLISTLCFEYDEVVRFSKFLKEKFNLETKVRRDNSLYIKHISKDLFTKLVKPYMCDCVLYKLHSPQ